MLDNDTVVRCSLDDKQCEPIAHASCAGYTTRGASRAKFLCADHRASKLLQGSKSKLKSQPKGNNSAAISKGKQQPPVTPSTSDSHAPCLCAVGGMCVSCCSTSAETGSTPPGDNEDLHEAFKLLTVKFHDLELSHKRENKELHMHVLVLEGRIHSLEEEVKGLRSKQPINQVTAQQEVRGKHNKERSYAKALNTKVPNTVTGNLLSRIGVNKGTHNTHGTRGTRVIFKQPSGNGEGQFTSRIIRNNSGRVQSQERQGSDLRRSPATQSPNFRIIWGTRFSTKEPEAQQALSALVPSKDSQSIRVKKSMRRSRDRTKWWFTVMAPEDTLATLENSWSVTECNMTWKLQKSLRQPGTPSEAGDATQASTSEEAVSTFPTEGMIAATSQTVTCDTLALPDTPVNMTEQSDLVTSDSTLCESEANPSPAASLHGEISLAGSVETAAHDPQCEPASVSDAHFKCPQGHQKCA